MNLLSDIITYVRRIIKSPSNAVITDTLIIDYINRFWIMDVDARIQLFDLKTKYQFQTQPGVDQYNMPLYDVQYEPSGQTAQSVGIYPVYQGFFEPAYVNGIQVPFQTQKTSFFNIYPNIVQQMYSIGVGDGVTTAFNFTFPVTPNNTTPPGIPWQYFLRGHVDITGIIATGFNVDPYFGTTINPLIPSTSIYPAVYIISTDAYNNSIVVQDSGQFLYDGANQPNYGLLMQPGAAPFGYSAMPGGYVTSSPITGITLGTTTVLTTTTGYVPGQLVEISNVSGTTQLNGNFYEVISNGGTTLTIAVNSLSFTNYISGGVVSTVQNVINYITGQGNLVFPTPPAAGAPISAQAFLFQCGLPRGILFNNNTLTFRSPPDKQYLVELDAYLSPAAFLNQPNAIPFGYMAEYIARGAARKILADTGDVEQFQFYEPFFREQEILVWKRSQRQFTATRTETIYSSGINMGQQGSNSLGGSTS
jgi:hypothetical protein